MRRALLKHVPELDRPKSLLESIELDQDSDLRLAIELEIDTLLTALQTTTRGRR